MHGCKRGKGEICAILSSLFKFMSQFDLMWGDVCLCGKMDMCLCGEMICVLVCGDGYVCL